MTILLCAGCSGIPFTPGRWFEPSPTPVSRQGGQTGTVQTDPDVQFDGVLRTVDGLTATFGTRLWMVKTTSQVSTPRPNGRVHAVLPFEGDTSVTNTSTRPNPAAASVVVEYSVGYPERSRLCELLIDPQVPNRYVAGGYCWISIGMATLFSYTHGPPVNIQPGEGYGDSFGTPSGSVAVAVDVPIAELDRISGELRQPAVIAATTNDIPGLGTTFRFAGACIDPTHAPTSATGPMPVQPGEQHAIIGATKTSPAPTYPT